MFYHHYMQGQARNAAKSEPSQIYYYVSLPVRTSALFFRPTYILDTIVELIPTTKHGSNPRYASLLLIFKESTPTVDLSRPRRSQVTPGQTRRATRKTTRRFASPTRRKRTRIPASQTTTIRDRTRSQQSKPRRETRETRQRA